MRGKLFMAGVGPKTSTGDALDVLTVIAMDVPGDQLRKWRTGMDQAVATAVAQRPTDTLNPNSERPARAGWGLEPDQIAATEQFHATFSAPPGGGD